MHEFTCTIKLNWSTRERESIEDVHNLWFSITLMCLRIWMFVKNGKFIFSLTQVDFEIWTTFFLHTCFAFYPLRECVYVEFMRVWQKSTKNLPPQLSSSFFWMMYTHCFFAPVILYIIICRAWKTSENVKWKNILRREINLVNWKFNRRVDNFF